MAGWRAPAGNTGREARGTRPCDTMRARAPAAQQQRCGQSLLPQRASPRRVRPRALPSSLRARRTDFLCARFHSNESSCQSSVSAPSSSFHSCGADAGVRSGRYGRGCIEKEARASMLTQWAPAVAGPFHETSADCDNDAPHSAGAAAAFLPHLLHLVHVNVADEARLGHGGRGAQQRRAQQEDGSQNLHLLRRADFRRGGQRLLERRASECGAAAQTERPRYATAAVAFVGATVVASSTGRRTLSVNARHDKTRRNRLLLVAEPSEGPGGRLVTGHPNRLAATPTEPHTPMNRAPARTNPV